MLNISTAISLWEISQTRRSLPFGVKRYDYLLRPAEGQDQPLQEMFLSLPLPSNLSPSQALIYGRVDQSGVDSLSTGASECQ